MATKAMEPIKATLKGINNMAVKPLIAVKDQASKILGSIGQKLKSLAKGVTIAVGASAGAVVGGALNEGAKLQQSTGGVETLFKGDAGVVVANANKAYKTAGLSANEYMEQVTSFSASLLSSLGGDTAKSAQIADKAMIDMADNANKFGTDISSIQNAYQGFAKQNYTMLDNLKLGYGGTQEEMKRLLSDAQKLTGVKYDISNLADVYNAIHAIQEDLGVAGTTSKEASETFSGSFSAMKSSAQNLLGALALGGDIKGSMSALVDTASTFLIGNLVPMVGQIITTLPEAIKTGISQASPKIKEMGKTIIDSLKAGMVSILPSSMRGMVDPLFSSLGSGIGKAVSGIKSLVSGIIPVVATVVTSLAPIVSDIGGMFERLAPVVQGAFEGAFGNAGGLFDTLVKAVRSALPVVETIIGTLATTVGAVMPSILNMFQSLGNVFVAVMPIISNLTTMLGSVIQAVYPVIYNTISMALNAIMPIITAFSGLIQSAMPIVQTIIQTFSNVVGTIFPVVENIFQGLGDKVAQIVGVVTSHMGLLQGIVETVAPIVEGAVTIIASVFSTAWDIISPIMDLAIGIFDALLTCIEKVFPTIQSIVSGVWGVLEGIFSGIAKGLETVGNAVSKVTGVIGDIGSGIAGALGFAYGKGRVPYDNYPAVLHAGEKVLTRNQADQYERSMSTRGVALSNTLKPVDSSVASDTPTTVAKVQEDKGGAPKDTVLNLTMNNTFTGDINNMGDMDTVADEMAERFVKRMRKLVPNLT